MKTWKKCCTPETSRIGYSIGYEPGYGVASVPVHAVNCVMFPGVTVDALGVSKIEVSGQGPVVLAAPIVKTYR